MIRSPLVIYHAHCMDGFAAACVVAQYLKGEGEYRPAQYDALEPYGTAGRDVFIVDFSYPPDVMWSILKSCRTLTWIDHHKTTADLARLLLPACTPASRHDQSACGALLTYQALFADSVVTPEVLLYVDDRDRWQWRLENSREVSAALALRWEPHWHDPTAVNEFTGMSAYSAFFRTVPDELVQTGRSMLRAQEARVESKSSRTVRLDGTALGHPWTGLDIAAINTDSDISETGSFLCETADVAVMYFADGDEWVHSLRSRDGVDVSAIAARYGGGGHHAAAGFRAGLPITLWNSPA